MLDPITLSPDDLMRTPIPDLVRAAAASAYRALRLAAMQREQPSEAVSAILDREKVLMRVRGVALRARSCAVARHLRRDLGLPFRSVDVRRSPVISCYAAHSILGAFADA